MQTTGYLIGIIVELTAGMQDRHNYFGSGTPFFFMNINRNATPIIRDPNTSTHLYNDFDRITMPGQGFIYRIIHHFKYHVV